jgi:hypothetical protein
MAPRSPPAGGTQPCLPPSGEQIPTGGRDFLFIRWQIRRVRLQIRRATSSGGGSGGRDFLFLQRRIRWAWLRRSLHSHSFLLSLSDLVGGCGCVLPPSLSQIRLVVVVLWWRRWLLWWWCWWQRQAVVGGGRRSGSGGGGARVVAVGARAVDFFFFMKLASPRARWAFRHMSAERGPACSR